MTAHDPEFRKSALRPLLKVVAIFGYPALWLTLLLLTLAA